jgi:hypothetical protein
MHLSRNVSPWVVIGARGAIDAGLESTRIIKMGDLAKYNMLVSIQMVAAVNYSSSPWLTHSLGLRYVELRHSVTKAAPILELSTNTLGTPILE